MSRITKSLLTLTLVAFSIVMLVSNINAQEAKFQQSSGDDGLVCMEAEHNTDLRESAGESYWELTEDPADFSGTGAYQAYPAAYNDHKDIVNAQANAPVLEYAVNFVKTDQLYVWGRSSHVDGYDDSVWFGFDGLIEGTQPLSYTTEEQPFANEWYWISHFMDGTRAVLVVPATGVHVFEIYMREPMYKIDKIVLTTNPDYNPGESDPMGPAETLVDTQVESTVGSAPTTFTLAQNYPNPFNPSTTIQYSLPTAEFVTLQVFDLAGKQVASLANSFQAAGNYQMTWTAEGLPSGLYFYRLQAGKFSETKKLTMQK
jgi:hypothetical protein